jgi:ATP-dependent RNA circularization protein (DNA/RNA ligase family)
VKELLCGQLKGFVLQGELCGPKIQKNLMGLTENDLFVFNVVDLQTQRRFSHVGMTKILEGTGLKTVPLWESGDSLQYTSDQCLEKAVGLYQGTKNQREGLIFRTIIDGIVCNSFKAVSNKYLDAKK